MSTLQPEAGKPRLTRFHYSLLALSSFIYAFTAMNVLLIAAVLTPIISEFNLANQPLTAGLLLSAGYLGMFAGALICGILADRVGRRKTLLFTLLMMTTFTALNAVAIDPLTMGILRFFAGIGLGGALPQPGIYISEYIPAKYRGRFLGLVEASWVYGALLSLAFPFVLFPMLGWRLTFLISLLPLVLVPFVYLFAPESLRFLQYKGKKQEITRLLEKHKLSMDEFEEKTPVTRDYSAKNALGEIWSRRFRRRTLMLWLAWAVLVYSYHGIFTWLPTFYSSTLGFTVVRSIQWVLIVTLAQVPGYYTGALLLDRVGRKRIAVFYLLFAAAGSALLSLAVEPNSILLWSIVISFFNLGAWSALYAYTPELYPTRIRGTASGAAASIGRLAGVIAPTATPLLYYYGGLPAAFAVFALVQFAGAIGILILGVETKGKTLEEIG
ncbi:MAG: MFS transporter [Candidatus Bathyarchaeota archaeon]|nr:MFS transporter [Candidatus Bathyarchaeota archaeon]